MAIHDAPQQQVSSSSGSMAVPQQELLAIDDEPQQNSKTSNAITKAVLEFIKGKTGKVQLTKTEWNHAPREFVDQQLILSGFGELAVKGYSFKHARDHIKGIPAALKKKYKYSKSNNI